MGVVTMKERQRLEIFIGKKILIIEECIPLREIISSICAKWGATPIAAPGPREFVFQALKIVPDLIIFHPGTEKRSGLYTCKLIKSLNETRHIPILLTTANHSAPYSKDYNFTAFDDFLLKPFGAEELLVKMEKMLG